MRCIGGVEGGEKGGRGGILAVQVDLTFNFLHHDWSYEVTTLATGSPTPKRDNWPQSKGPWTCKVEGERMRPRGCLNRFFHLLLFFSCNYYFFHIKTGINVALSEGVLLPRQRVHHQGGTSCTSPFLSVRVELVVSLACQ